MSWKPIGDAAAVVVNRLEHRKIDLRDVLIGSVSALLQQYADALHSATGENVMIVEAELYRLLEVNCSAKAKMAEAFKDLAQ
jgi:hypothetical protein